MKARIPQTSFLLFLVLNFITLGIYGIVYWTKVSKEVDILCEGDGKKTMKYVYVWLLDFVTLGIMSLVWKFMLEERLKDNAERYNLRFSESGALVVFGSILGTIALGLGPILALFILNKNVNALIGAYNDYNGLVDPYEDERANIFADEEEKVG